MLSWSGCASSKSTSLACVLSTASLEKRRIAEVCVLRGGFALDALYLLARNMDRTGELVGLEHPAFHHIQDLPRSEAEILGRLPHGDFLAVFVFHPTNLLVPGKDGGQDTP
jgi:hypothetical protein